MPVKNDVDKFREFILKLHLNFDQHTEELEYQDSALILVDAVLSMNRRYNSFVVPRIKLIKVAGIKTLDELNERISSEGTIGFCNTWQYRHPERVEILNNLVKKFLKIKKRSGITDDLEALHFWGKNSNINNFKDFAIKGMGFTTFQYLRLMCGADTAKPDVHLKRAVKDGTGSNMSETEIVRIVETVAKQIGVSARQLDYAIWRYYSNKISRQS